MRNPVTKFMIKYKRNAVHRDKKKDYKRREKHKKSLVD